MSSPSDLLLAVDMQNRQLASFNGSVTTFRLSQDNVVSLKVMCLNPSATSSPATPRYVLQDMAGLALQAEVGPTPEGNPHPAVLASQPALVWDPTNKWFAGDLDLNTEGIDTFLGTRSSDTAYFELSLIINSGLVTILPQLPFTLLAVLAGLGGQSPTPAQSFYTSAQSDSKFVPQVGAPGQTFQLVSPNGLLGIEVGCDNNGNLTTKEITLA